MTLEPVVLTVTQLNTYLKAQFEGDENLSQIFITGEISNFTDNYRSGHLYFTLKDERCSVRAVMFARNASRLRFQLEDGMKVIARGRVSIYEVTGQYQLYVEDLQPDGLGALNLAFEQLKEKLEKEGLFAAERKKSLPKIPQRIGVITSPTGAAVHDIFTILERRWPLAQVVFCPVQVQGNTAAPQIVNALRLMNQKQCADIIIVGRGGGSLEDLWAFNEECVARAVSESSIPVISAVGHETDFTICDFAADLRAPTPSAAAELAVPDKAEMLAQFSAQKMRLKNAIEVKLQQVKEEFLPLAESRVMKNPLESIEICREKIDCLAASAQKSTLAAVNCSKEALAALSGKLNALSPLAVLSRGYAAVFQENGTSILSSAVAEKDDKVEVRFSDGSLACTVNERKAGTGNE